MFVRQQEHSKELNILLKFDPLYEASKITGKNYKEDKETGVLGLQLHLHKNALKTRLLQGNNDTCFANTFEENIAVIEDLGFELQLQGKTQDTENDEWRIYYMPGYLLFCESFNNSLNSGKLYFNYRVDTGGKEEARKQFWEAVSGCSGGCLQSEKDDVFTQIADFDIREGLRNKILCLEENGEVLEQWLDQPFMWLLTHKDIEVDGYDHEALNRDRMSQLPEDIQLKILNTTKEHIEGCIDTIVKDIETITGSDKVTYNPIKDTQYKLSVSNLPSGSDSRVNLKEYVQERYKIKLKFEHWANKNTNILIG